MRTSKTLCLLSIAAWITSASITSYAGNSNKPVLQAPVQSATQSFIKSDLNGNGYITPDEFAEANHLSSINPTSGKDIRAIRIMAAFHEMDQDEDKEVSKVEYIRYMEKIGG